MVSLPTQELHVTSQLTWQYRRGHFARPHLFIFFLISSCFPALGSSGLGHNLFLVWFGQTGQSYPPWMCRTLQHGPSPVHSMFFVTMESHFHWFKQSRMLWRMDHLWVMLIYTPPFDIKWYYEVIIQNLLPTTTGMLRNGDWLWKQSPRTFPHRPSERWSFLR